MGITSDHEFTDYSFRHSFFRNMEVRPSGFTISVMFVGCPLFLRASETARALK